MSLVAPYHVGKQCVQDFAYRVGHVFEVLHFKLLNFFFEFIQCVVFYDFYLVVKTHVELLFQEFDKLKLDFVGDLRVVLSCHLGVMSQGLIHD